VKVAAWIALGVVLVGAIVGLVVRSEPSHSVTARAERLEHQLACPVCEGQSVFDSNAPESQNIRADIPRRIRAGQSDAQIRAAYVSIYGDRILLTPANDGLGFLAWGIPVLALVLGAAIIFLALQRWSRTPRLAATADDEDIVRRAREEHDDDQ
jgi:cytochrome c-type biogenesis protein CcmH